MQAEPRGFWQRSVLKLGPARLTTVVVLVLGGGLIVTAGAVIDPSAGYASAALLEIGAALFLAVPLILLERLLSGRVERAREEVQDRIDSVAADVHRTQSQIEHLGEETRSRIAAKRESDKELLRRLSAEPTERNVWNALHRAQQFSALDPAGVRVRIPESSLRVRFNAVAADEASAGSVDISVEDRDGRQITGFESWTFDERAADALTALVEDLWRRGAYPDDERFDATDIFKRLASALGTVLTLWTNGRAGGALGPVVELDDPWALTQYGVEHVTDARRKVARRQLLDDRNGARERLRADDGDADESIDDVLETAVQYHKGVAQRAVDQRAPRR